MNNDELLKIRREIYSKKGFYIFKNFIAENDLNILVENWTSDIAFSFSDFVPNKDVKPGTDPYAYFRPSEKDFAYCTQIWNKPLDDLMHSYVYQAQFIRNKIEGNPIFLGLHESTGKALQYRVCRTVSSGPIVNKHADFFDEHRNDPTGDHLFDPSKVQLTLFLSNFDKDYKDGGFKLWLDDTKPTLFGDEVNVDAGDLVVWRYSIPHEVSNVTCIDPKIGFLRVIFPQFDIQSNKEISI